MNIKKVRNKHSPKISKKMELKPLRVFYLLVLVVSLGLASAFYWQYQLKDKQLSQYQDLNQMYTKIVTEINTKLSQNKEELEKSLQEIEQLNKTITVLEEDKAGFQSELQVLKDEKEKLEAKIARLSEERTTWEQKFVFLQEKFQSLEELKKAIRTVKAAGREQWRKERLAKIERVKVLDRIALQQGNRGYLVKNSKSTFRPTKIRVELEPTGTWSYREIESQK